MGSACSRPRVGDVSLPVVPISDVGGKGGDGRFSPGSSRSKSSFRLATMKVVPLTPSSAGIHSPREQSPSAGKVTTERVSSRSGLRSLKHDLRSPSTQRPSLLLTPAPSTARATTDLPLRGHTVLDDLRMSAFGSALPAAVLSDFARFFQVQHLGVGDVIFSPGEEATALYLVRSGVVAIRAERPPPGKTTEDVTAPFHARVASDSSSTPSAPGTPTPMAKTPATQSPTLTAGLLHDRVPSITDRIPSSASSLHPQPTAAGTASFSQARARSRIRLSSGSHGFGSGIHTHVTPPNSDTNTATATTTSTPEHAPAVAPTHTRNSLSVADAHSIGHRRRSGEGLLRSPGARASLARHLMMSELSSHGEEPGSPACERGSRGSILARTLPLMMKTKSETFGQECLRSHQHLRVTWAIAETPVVLLAITTADLHAFLAAYPDAATHAAAAPTTPPTPQPLSLTSAQIREKIINSLGQTIDSVLEQHLDLGPAKLSLLTSLFNFVHLEAGECLLREGTMGSFVTLAGGAGSASGASPRSGEGPRVVHQTSNSLFFLYEGTLSCTIRGDPSSSAPKLAKLFDAYAPIAGRATANQNQDGNSSQQHAPNTHTHCTLVPPSSAHTSPVVAPRQLAVARTFSPLGGGAAQSRVASHPGFFGDLGMLLDIPRTATIHAVSDCVLLELQQDRWRNFLQLAPEVLGLFAKKITSTYSIHILHLLNQPAIARAFVEFCRAEYSLENYHCWLAAVHYRTTFNLHLLHASRNKQAADDIVERFITHTADTPVNLKGVTAQTILARWRAGAIDSDLFLAAEEEVLSLMNSDSFARFKSSVAFQRVLTEINAAHLDGTGVDSSNNNLFTTLSQVPTPQQQARTATQHTRLQSGATLRRSHTHRMLVASPPPAVGATIVEAPSLLLSPATLTVPMPPRSPPTSPLSGRASLRATMHRQSKSSVEDLSLRQLSRLAMHTSTAAEPPSTAYRSSIESVAEMLTSASTVIAPQPRIAASLSVSAPHTPLIPRTGAEVPPQLSSPFEFELVKLDGLPESLPTDSPVSPSCSSSRLPSVDGVVVSGPATIVTSIAPSPYSESRDLPPPGSVLVVREDGTSMVVSTPSFLVRSLSDPTASIAHPAPALL